MAINVQTVESVVRETFGFSVPGAIKMLLVFGICVGTAVVFTDVTCMIGQRRRLIQFHVTVSLVTACLSFVFFFAKPWPPHVTNRVFDNEYAFLPGYAEGLMLGMAYPFLLCLMMTIVAILQADRRTVTGRSLLLIVPGAAILTVYAALRIGYLFAARYGLMNPTPTPLAISRALAATGVLFIAAGILAAMSMNWFSARKALRQFSALRAEMLIRWPGAARESRQGSSAGERVDDRAAEALDAISLEVEYSDLPDGDQLPPPVAAMTIAAWLTSGRVTEGLGRNTFFPGPGTTETEWACILGTAYQAASENERKLVVDL
ncbi:hypothetical protein ACWDUD_27950 [Rhodococcus sp. NPDC003382]